METLDSLAALPRRSAVIREWKQGGGLIAAVLPIHYPRSLLRAYGYLPVEVWGPPGVDASHGAAHLQSTICSVVHNALSFLLSGGLEVADLLVVPHACDSLQGLGSILLDFVPPRQPVLPLYLPRGRRESDLAFLAAELESLARRLSEINGRSPDAAGLLAAIEREEEADGLLAQLHRRRDELPLSGADLYRLIRGREYLPAERFVELAQAVLARASRSNRDRPDSRVPIILSGILLEPAGLLEAIEGMGGRVVADDLAGCGRRLYPPGRSPEPFRRMAERIVAGPPDPTRGSPIDERLAHLRGLVERTGARGIVFYDVKFCEPELFDLPQLRLGLQALGVATLTVEMDLNDRLSQRVLTRLEAFVEMIRPPQILGVP